MLWIFINLPSCWAPVLHDVIHLFHAVTAGRGYWSTGSIPKPDPLQVVLVVLVWFHVHLHPILHSIQIIVHWTLLPHSGPTWKFQPCWISCNLASWTMLAWFSTCLPPTHPPLGKMKWSKEAKNLGGCQRGYWIVSEMCLEGRMSLGGVRMVTGRCLEGVSKESE